MYIKIRLTEGVSPLLCILSKRLTQTLQPALKNGGLLGCMKSLNYTKLGKMLKLCMEVSAGKVADVKVDYYGIGPCGELQVKLYPGGWMADSGWLDTLIKSDSDLDLVILDLQAILGTLIKSDSDLDPVTRDLQAILGTLIRSDADCDLLIRDLQSILGNGEMPELKAKYKKVIL